MSSNCYCLVISVTGSQLTVALAAAARFAKDSRKRLKAILWMSYDMVSIMYKLDHDLSDEKVQSSFTAFTRIEK